jgi:hypothetical protein
MGVAQFMGTQSFRIFELSVAAFFDTGDVSGEKS